MPVAHILYLRSLSKDKRDQYSPGEKVAPLIGNQRRGLPLETAMTPFIYANQKRAFVDEYTKIARPALSHEERNGLISALLGSLLGHTERFVDKDEDEELLMYGDDEHNYSHHVQQQASQNMLADDRLRAAIQAQASQQVMRTV
jgi:hypothetical protein